MKVAGVFCLFLFFSVHGGVNGTMITSMCGATVLIHAKEPAVLLTITFAL